jgi:hypothetical protein
MRVQIANPDRHDVIADLPFYQRLSDWSLPNLHEVLGLHRHVVQLVEFPTVSYVVKELPDDLALREYRLLRAVAEDGLPTVEVVAVATERDVGESLLVTRHLDYSLPYRSLLMGRGLEIPFLGERLLDAMVALLVRVHLAGFFWGDCSLSNTLFRRDAGALQAYIIDLETAEHHDKLTDGQRDLDVSVATDNIAGGLLDLQAAGRLAAGIDPIDVALAVEERYLWLWNEITTPATTTLGDSRPIRERLDRLHEMGFAIEEAEVVSLEDGRTLSFIPKVVEHGYHAEQLATLTGLRAGDNQARRMLQDIKQYHAYLQDDEQRTMPFNVAAVRWLDRVFEPTMAAIPDHLFDRLEPAEIFHQLLEHRWLDTERNGTERTLLEILPDYLDILDSAPAERLQLSSADDTGEES